MIAPRLPVLCLLTCFVVPAASAQSATALNGVYNGTYTCAQGSTKMKLSLMASPSGDVSALFTFYLPPGTQKQAFSYSLRGQYNSQTAKISLVPVRWETASPPNFGMVGMNGTFTSDELAGTITGPGCRGFNVERDRAESANIAAVMSAQKTGTNAATPPPPQPPPQDAFAAALLRQAPNGVRPAVSAPAAAQPKPAPAGAPVASAATKPAIEKPAPSPVATNVSAPVAVVQEPQNYWSGYRTDMIRQVFDGGFGSARGSAGGDHQVKRRKIARLWLEPHQFAVAKHTQEEQRGKIQRQLYDEAE